MEYAKVVNAYVKMALPGAIVRYLNVQINVEIMVYAKLAENANAQKVMEVLIKLIVGEDCSQVLCKDNCNSNGQCDFTNGICKCFDGFEGEACQKKVCLNNCSGNGTCSQVTKTCICNTGYSGEDCSKKVCVNNCSSNGFYNEGICYCKPGFEGN